MALRPPSPVIDASGDVRKPPADVLVTRDRVYVTLEIPGASREEIDLEATERAFSVHARGCDGRVYDREIELPDPAGPAGCRSDVPEWGPRHYGSAAHVALRPDPGGRSPWEMR